LSLREAMLIIAILGGFVKGKGMMTGVEVMWRGIRRLEDIAIGVSLAKGKLFNEGSGVYHFNSG